MSDTSLQTAQKLLRKGIETYTSILYDCILTAPVEELLKYGVYLMNPEYEMYDKIKQISARAENLDKPSEQSEIPYPSHINLDLETIKERITQEPEVIEKFLLSEIHQTRIDEKLNNNSDYLRIIKGLSLILNLHPQLFTQPGFWEIAIENQHRSNIGESGLIEYNACLDFVKNAMSVNQKVFDKISNHVNLYSKEFSQPNTQGEQWVETGDLTHIWPDLIYIIDQVKHHFGIQEKLKELTNELNLNENRKSLEKDYKNS